VKLHENPVVLRFVACSGANGLKKPPVWLTHMFRAVHQDLCASWSDLLRNFGKDGRHYVIDWAGEAPWYASQSAQVVRAIELFNSQPTSYHEFLDSGGWQGYDVVRLYTNIDIADLNEKLGAVLQLVWQRHEHTVLQVFKDKYQPDVWYDNMAAAHTRYSLLAAATANTNHRKNDRLGRDKYKGEFYLFDLQHASHVVHLLTENSYVQFGGRFFKQARARGIPMGINPAVYMANFYLFYYERCFLQRLLDLYKRACSAAGHAPSRCPADWDSAGIAALLAEPPGFPEPTGANAPQEWLLWSQAVLFLVHQFQGSQAPLRDFDQLVEGPWPISTSCPPGGLWGRGSAFWRENSSKHPPSRAQNFDQLVEDPFKFSEIPGLGPSHFDPSTSLRALTSLSVRYACEMH
jgi:hypothetical protein